MLSAYVAFWKRQGSIGIILKNSKIRGTLQRNSALWSMLMTDKRKHSITKNINYGLTIWSFFKKRYTRYKLSCDKNLEGCELNIHWKGFVAQEQICVTLSCPQNWRAMGLMHRTSSLDIDVMNMVKAIK